MTNASLPRSIAQDTLYALRLFGRHRGGLIVTVAGVAVALGLSTGLVTALNAVYAPRAGVPNRESLLWIRAVGDVLPGPAGSGVTFGQGWTYRDFEAIRDEVTGTRLATHVAATRSLQTADGQRHDGVRVGVVSGGFFQVAGVSPVLGRLLDDRDEAAGERVAVVSHQLWSRLYSRSRAVLGSTLYLDDAPFVVVGVVQAPFAGPSLASRELAWLPATAVSPDRNVYLQSSTSILARLPSAAERARFGPQAAAAVERGTGRRFSVELQQAMRPLTFPSGERSVIPAVLALTAAVVFVALFNLAGFLVTLATARQREIGVRLAMGATHGRLVRQFLTESLLIAGVAGALGALAVHACVSLLVRLLDLPLGMAIEVDGRAYVFLAVAMLGMAVAAGLAPLRYAARLQVAADLSGDASRLRLAGRPERLRSVFVGVQVAMSVVLIVTGALLMRAATTARQADVGFDAQQLLVVNGLWIGRDWDVAAAASYWDDAIARVTRLPDVERTAFVQYVPGGSGARTTTPSGHAVALNRTSPEYFETAGIRLVRGRVYTDLEVAQDAPVAVVSEKLARHLWGDAESIGASLGTLNPGLADVTVVGIVSDAVTTDLFELSRGMGTVYQPLAPSFLPYAFLVVRTGRDARLAGRELAEAFPRFPADGAGAVRPRRVADALDNQIAVLQLPARIANLAGLAILLLTVAGVHGLAALVVRQRLYDIAVRVVLGATPRAAARYAAGLALRPAIWGLAAGAVGAFVAAQALSLLLLGVSGLDPVALGSAATVIVAGLVAGVAGPVRHAGRVAPTELLRA